MPTDPATLLLLADAVLVAHAALALFLAGGLALIWLGGWRGWRWVLTRPFRVLHLAGMAVVALESVVGVACPLTEVELALRVAAHVEAYRGGFIAHWVGRLLFYDVDARVFLALYLAALGLTLLAWLVVRPGAGTARGGRGT